MHLNRSDQIDALYREAVALADRARGWFDGPGIAWRAGLPAAARAAVATESLAITARLMAAIAWLLNPAHQQQGGSPPAFAFPADVHRPPPQVLENTPAMALAARSRQLVARVLAMAPRAAATELSTDALPIEASPSSVAPVDETHGKPVSDIITETGGFWRA